jgi:hypothetical protein
MRMYCSEHGFFEQTPHSHISRPEILANGKIRLHESWEWTSGDKSTGKSIIEEL